MPTVDPFRLFTQTADLKLEKVILEEHAVSFLLRSVAASARCPKCGQPSPRVHSHYHRQMTDLPAHGAAIRIGLRVRRFFCLTIECPQRIFTERLPDVVAPHARTTVRLHGTHRDIGLALGGEAGARLAARLAMPTSPDTLLRRVRDIPAPKCPRVRVLGIDDWAFRKGQRYGMILCDLERRCPIDLLAERSADALCAWLKDHPEVEIIIRDRGDDMIRGATAGAPLAVQVADRWHLLRNLRDALVGTVDRHRREVRRAAHGVTSDPSSPAAAADSPAPSEPVPASDPAGDQIGARESASRARRIELYEQVQEFSRQGLSDRVIGARLGLHRATVRRYRAADAFPERAERCYERGTDGFLEHLKQRWSAGCRNAALLFRELQARGFIGSYYMVRRQLAVWRNGERSPAPEGTSSSAPGVPVGRLPSRRITSLLLKGEADHEPEERAFIARLQEGCPDLRRATELARDFTAMVRDRQVDRWDDWLARATDPGGIKELRTFAEGLKRDEAAVRAALRLEWSNGQVEGAVNRLKTIKRQMYGRANFDLLRQRVLAA